MCEQMIVFQPRRSPTRAIRLGAVGVPGVCVSMAV